MTGRPWTPADHEVIESMYGDHPAAVIAKRLDRTTSSVHNRAQRLGLGANRPHDVLTANQVMDVLGVTSFPTLQRWVREGWLPAERKPAAYGKATRPEWWIRQGDIERFLGEYPHLVDRDRIDPTFRRFAPGRWVTLVQAFRRGAAHPNLLDDAVKAGLIPEARKRGEGGTVWAIPESIVPALTAARRRMTTDAEHRRLVVAYDRLQRRGALKRRKTAATAMARRLSDGGHSGRSRVAA